MPQITSILRDLRHEALVYRETEQTIYPSNPRSRPLTPETLIPTRTMT